MSLEDEKCPHCGELNPNAQQHIKDMKHYKGEFDRTRWDVYSTVGKYKQMTVRIVLIAVLIVCIGITWLVSTNAYSIRRNMLERESARNVKKYCAQLDQYIEQENFEAIVQFSDEHAINVSIEEYDPYVPVIWTATYYQYICKEIMNLAVDLDDEELEPTLKRLGDDLAYFYSSCDPERYSYYKGADCEQNRKAIHRMKENVLLMMQTYCGLTKEECEGFENLSDAKKTALIEERMVADE